MRRKLRSQGEVVERCRVLRDELRAAVARLPEEGANSAVVDAVWRGEALGTLLWALQLAELPPYDQPFDPAAVVALETDGAELRDAEEAGRVKEALKARGILISTDGPLDNVLKIKPPLVISAADCDRVLAALAECL